MEAEVPIDAGHAEASTAALLHVLRRLDVPTRLGVCARVCVAWRDAALAASSMLELECCSQPQCSSLQSWLRTRAAQLQMRSVSLRAHVASVVLPADAWAQLLEVQLPVQALRQLRELRVKLLRCSLVDVPATEQAGSKTATIVQQQAWGRLQQLQQQPAAPSLSALAPLTKLCVLDSIMSLEGLAELEGMQHLELSHGWGAPPAAPKSSSSGSKSASFPPLSATPGTSGTSSPSSSSMGLGAGGDSSSNLGDAGTGAAAAVSALAHALPRLNALTHLSLAGGMCCPEALSQLSAVSSLQELVLGWVQLPKPLIAGYEAHAGGLQLQPGNMPLGGLTGLRKLVVAYAAESVDPAVLATATALTHLQLDGCRLQHGLGARLSVLRGLRQLAHLSLTQKQGSVLVLTTDDCDGLTASTALTYLGLTGCQLPPDGCAAMFGPGVQLPALQRLEAPPSLLADATAVSRISACCPALRALSTQPTTAASTTAAYVDLVGIKLLQLTQLALGGVTVVGGQSLKALAHECPGLQELEVSSVRAITLTDVMQLAACRELRVLKLPQLHITGVLAAQLSLTTAGQASAPDVWLQLPQAVIKQALWLFPFRLQHKPEELAQVAELLDACSAHFAVRQDTSAHQAQLQARVLELGQGLVMLQQSSQQQPMPPGPARQHWQLQCQKLREAILQSAEDLQASIVSRGAVDAEQQQRQQQQPATSTAVVLAAPPYAPAPGPGPTVTLVSGPHGGGSSTSTGSSGGSTADVLVHQQQLLAPLQGAACGGAPTFQHIGSMPQGLMAPAAMMLPGQQQQVPVIAMQQPGMAQVLVQPQQYQQAAYPQQQQQLLMPYDGAQAGLMVVQAPPPPQLAQQPPLMYMPAQQQQPQLGQDGFYFQHPHSTGLSFTQQPQQVLLPMQVLLPAASQEQQVSNMQAGFANFYLN